MARPLKRDSETTRADLLAAAARAFGERGFDGARLADIAREAGISRPSLLYHFPSKDALYEAVVRDGFGGLGARLSGALSRRAALHGPAEAAVREFRRFLESRPEMARLLVRELLAGDGAGARVLLDEVAPLLDLVEAGLGPRRGGAGREGVRVREAVLAIAASMLLRRASGGLGERLWGRGDGSERLASALLGNGTLREVNS